MQVNTMPPKRAATPNVVVEEVETNMGYASIMIYLFRFTNPALDDSKGPMACLQEVLKKLAEHLQLHVSTLAAYIKNLPAKCLYRRHASLLELAFLKQLKVVGKEGNNVMLISFTSVAHMLQGKGMSNAACSFREARDMHVGASISLGRQGPAPQRQRHTEQPQAVVVEQHGHVEAPGAQLQAQDLMQQAPPQSHDEAIQQVMDSSQFLEVGAPIVVEGALLDFPSVIPEWAGLHSKLGWKLGSLPDLEDPILAREMDAVHRFHTASINFHRQKGPVKETSWHNTQGCILRYMGFCMKFHAKHPSPKLVLDIPMFAEFLGYVKAKEVSGAYLRTYCATATMVLLALPSTNYIKAALKWLQHAGTQLHAEAPFKPLDIPMLESQHQ